MADGLLDRHDNLRHVASAQDRSQMDPYFKSDPDVIKTYTFDYDKIVAFEQELAFSETKLAMVGLI